MSITTAPHTRTDQQSARARGFALYVGIDEETAEAAGIPLAELVDRLRRLVGELVPGSQTHATVAIAPAGAGGRDIDVVRAALHEPGLQRQRAEAEPAPRRRTGVVIDISRKRVTLDGDTASLTFTEFELLQFLVLREGRAVDRQEITRGVWRDAPAEDVPNARTIDVHIRRLRAKLGDYEDIVRTVRGAGYRFDRHADVAIRMAATPSPDVF